MEHHETNPLKWPDGWARTRIQDRKPQAAWKKTQRLYYEMMLRELERLGATSALLTINTDPRDPGVAVYFSRKKEDFTWQDMLGLQGIVPTKDQIDKAYRERARKVHPEGQTPDLPMFLEISKAKENAVKWITGAPVDHEHVIACDTFNETRLNVAAIKHTLTALRTIERCGASSVLDRVMDKTFARQLIPENSSVNNHAPTPA
jgi:hypothetical protein